MINVGIIGLGRSGWDLHAKSLNSYSDYTVTAVCDVSSSRLDQAAAVFGATPYPDVDALVTHPELDLVVVTSPNNFHAAHAVAASRAGKHVVVDKPMATTLADADAMIAAAREAKRLITVFHSRHWDRDYRMVKSLLQSDLLGRLLTLDSRIQMSGPLWPTYGVPEFNPRWRVQAASGGGYLADWGPHMLEQLLDLLGERPARVACELRSDVWSDEVDDYFSMRLTFPSGVTATVEGSNNARFVLPRWFVVGKEGTLIAPGDFGHWTDVRIRTRVKGIDAEILPTGAGLITEERLYNSGQELSDYFYSNLLEVLEGPETPAITTTHARDVMVVLDAAHRAHDTGTSVALSDSDWA